MSIMALELAGLLNLPVLGNAEMEVDAPCSIDKVVQNGISFIGTATPEYLKMACQVSVDFVLVCTSEVAEEFLKAKPNSAVIVSPNPKLDFAKALEYLDKISLEWIIDEHASVEGGSYIAQPVSIGRGSFIGRDVIMGGECRIGKNVVIEGPVVMGANVEIKSNSVIGEPGFNFLRDGDNYIRFPHISGVQIGDNVSIGACSTVERGILTNTIIGEDVKIDDLCQIGHGVVLGKQVRVAAGTILCGRVQVGEGTWISPKVTIIQGAKVGKRCLIGIGANLLTDAGDNGVYVGNPARRIRDVEKGDGPIIV